MVPVPVDLGKICDGIKTKVVKKTEFDEFDEIKKVNDIKTDTSDLVEKNWLTQSLMKSKKKDTDHDHGIYIITQELNKLTADNFAARLKQANLASKNDIANFVKKEFLMKN